MINYSSQKCDDWFILIIIITKFYASIFAFLYEKSTLNFNGAPSWTIN